MNTTPPHRSPEGKSPVSPYRSNFNPACQHTFTPPCKMIRHIVSAAASRTTHWWRTYTWLREPPLLVKQKVCLLASYSERGSISDHTRYLAAHWRQQGFVVLAIIASPQSHGLLRHAKEWADVDGLMVRRNAGYDFGSWAAALQSRPDICAATLLAMTNDSVYGPFDGFAALLTKAQSSAADVIGMTDSYEVRHHIQSYLIFYTQRALTSAAFRSFWSTRKGNSREQVILNSEVMLMSAMQKGGLSTEVLFPLESKAVLNPTLFNWRSLIEAGFPFLKIQVLRDRAGYVDVTGWEDVLSRHGFDPEWVRQHLGTTYTGSAAEAGASTTCSAEASARSITNGTIIGFAGIPRPSAVAAEDASCQGPPVS